MSTARKLRIAFLTFALIVGSATTGGILYLQSQTFGDFVKRLISERSPRKLGIVGDFSHLKLYLFPPGVGVVNPRIRIERENVSRLPIDGEIEAGELRVGFAPIQMLSGTLHVSEVEVRSGKVKALIHSQVWSERGRKSAGGKLDWQDLFQLQIDGFRFVDTKLDVQFEMPDRENSLLGADLVVTDLALGRGKVGGKDGIVSRAEVNSIRVQTPEGWKPLPVREAVSLKWSLGLNDSGLEIDPFSAELAGVRLEMKGRVDGNLLDPASTPKLQAKVRAEADLSTFFLSNLGAKDWSGELRITSSLQAQLKDFMKTLKANFELEGRGIQWRRMRADQVSASGALDLANHRIELGHFEALDANGPGGGGDSG